MPGISRDTQIIRKGGGIVYRKAKGLSTHKGVVKRRKPRKKQLDTILFCDKIVARRLIRTSKSGRKIVEKDTTQARFVHLFPAYKGQKMHLNHPIKTSLAKYPREVSQWLQEHYFV